MIVMLAINNVYDGEEHKTERVVDVPAPKPEEDIDDWADEHLHDFTGDGNAVSKNAGYFVEITRCEDRPDLVGREFEWFG